MSHKVYTIRLEQNSVQLVQTINMLTCTENMSLPFHLEQVPGKASHDLNTCSSIS
jgi:hypothetical protein